MRLSLHHVHQFNVLAEELHFGRAADVMNIAQPALSRTIKQLESQVGVLLFERDNRNVQLTSAGRVFLAGSLQLIESMESTVLQAQKASQGEAGNLVVGYTDFAICGVLPEILRDFTDQYPDISVEPVHGFTGAQLDNLESGKLDLGFVTGPFSKPGFDSVVVQQNAFAVVLYESHPLAKKKSIKISDLSKEAFIFGSSMEWAHYHDHLFKIFRMAGIEPRIVQQAFNTEGIFGLIACQMGITVQLDCARNYLRKGLIVKPIEDVSATVPTLAVWKQTSKPSPVRIVAEFLQDRYCDINSSLNQI